MKTLYDVVKAHLILRCFQVSMERTLLHAAGFLEEWSSLSLLKPCFHYPRVLVFVTQQSQSHVLNSALLLDYGSAKSVWAHVPRYRHSVRYDAQQVRVAWNQNERHFLSHFFLVAVLFRNRARQTPKGSFLFIFSSRAVRGQPSQFCFSASTRHW